MGYQDTGVLESGAALCGLSPWAHEAPILQAVASLGSPIQCLPTAPGTRHTLHVAVPWLLCRL